MSRHCCANKPGGDKYTLIAVLAGIYVLLGTAFDGVSMIVLTTSMITTPK